MKFNMIKNDKSTVWDEVILAIMVILALGIGIALVVIKPSFGIVSANTTTITGVFFIFFGAMFLPALVYRLFTNEKSH